MKKFLIAASWFALNCYAAEHSRGAEIIYSGPDLGASTSILMNASDIGYKPGPFDIYFGPTTGQFVTLASPIYTYLGHATVKWSTGVVLSREPNQIELELDAHFPGYSGLPSVPVDFTFDQERGPGYPITFTDKVAWSFDSPPVRGAPATPEASTLVMLTIGLGLLALPKLAKRRVK